MRCIAQHWMQAPAHGLENIENIGDTARKSLQNLIKWGVSFFTSFLTENLYCNRGWCFTNRLQKSFDLKAWNEMEDELGRKKSSVKLAITQKVQNRKQVTTSWGALNWSCNQIGSFKSYLSRKSLWKCPRKCFQLERFQGSDSERDSEQIKNESSGSHEFSQILIRLNVWSRMKEKFFIFNWDSQFDAL